ncbi:LYS5 [Candida theae]|uniref:holo-[acyl-carrier-protein] synthase n=1 Tax=Candida theae TaxID=1198502 RepID=A0AAD5BFJ2_9ASCO|nr:LYS5 [Candida theae]KAI5958813.1 LYS5 [Candida theae]
MNQLHDFEKNIIVVITRVTPELNAFLQDDFNFESTLRLLGDLPLQAKIQQLGPPLRYKQLISILLTRCALNKVLGNPVFQKVSFEYNKFGKPSIEGLEFNSSSSNDIFAIALHSFPIGIDLSHSTQNVSSTDYKKQFEPIFHKLELRQLDSYFKFNHFWTLKEAFTKLIGCGLNVELSDFYFVLNEKDEFGQDNYCLTKPPHCSNDFELVDVNWYDKITTNADNLFEERSEFVDGLENEFYCYSTVLDKSHGEKLPVICSIITQLHAAQIITYNVDFLAILQRHLEI